MISPENAANLVLKKTGYKKLCNVRDYDSQHYVVMAIPDDEHFKDYQTVFGVDKETGAITNFILNSESIEAFQNAKIVFK